MRLIGLIQIRMIHLFQDDAAQLNPDESSSSSEFFFTDEFR